MLGAGCWSSSLQSAVEWHAIGHRRRCCWCALSSLSLHCVLSLSHRTHRRHRAVPSHCAPRRRRTPSLLSPCVVVVVAMRCCCCRHALLLLSPCVVVVVAMRRRCCHHALLLSSLCRRLAVPHAIVHRRCTVMPLSRRWICCRRLPPSLLLCHLRHRAVGRRHRGATGHRRHTVFASLGLPLSLLGIAMPCTRPAAPLCHPTTTGPPFFKKFTVIYPNKSLKTLR